MSPRRSRRAQNKTNSLDLTDFNAQYWLNPNEARRAPARRRSSSACLCKRSDCSDLFPSLRQVIKSGDGYGFSLADAKSICLDDCPEARPALAALVFWQNDSACPNAALAPAAAAQQRPLLGVRVPR
jgi:hypothetical protein